MTAALAPPERRAAPASAPALSIVVASVNGWDCLGPTLDSIDGLPERSRIEVVVVVRDGRCRDRLRDRASRVVVVECDGRLTIPRMRYLGVTRSRGDLVAILEDHAEVDAGWASAMLDAHRGPWGAVGGAVENGREGAVNWAAFLCEYAPYMRPVPDGPHDDLPGNNIAYKRTDLLRHAHVLDEGRWESWINERLRDEGVPTLSTDRAVVRHIKGFRLGYFLAQRFHFCRSYAGMRRPDQSWRKRFVYGFGSAALPPILLARVARQVASKRRHVGRFLASLPLIAAFFAVGAAGEMVGYLLGPGRSLDRVE